MPNAIEFITIKFGTGSAAFDDDNPAEIVRILRELADRFESGNPPSVIRDINGNFVGECQILREKD